MNNKYFLSGLLLAKAFQCLQNLHNPTGTVHVVVVGVPVRYRTVRDS